LQRPFVVPANSSGQNGLRPVLDTHQTGSNERLLNDDVHYLSRKLCNPLSYYAQRNKRRSVPASRPGWQGGTNRAASTPDPLHRHVCGPQRFIGFLMAAAREKGGPVNQAPEYTQ
jgi:hypothetical protein